MSASLVATAVVAALAGIAGGWALARRKGRSGVEAVSLSLHQQIENLRDEIWELKGAAAERDRAEAANEAKSRFLATVSHEMRTPLNGILGMADLMRGPNLTAEQAYYLEMVRASGGALASLIEEVLDFSKIEAGKLELVNLPFKVAPLVERVAELLAPRAQGKGLEIASFVAADVPPVLMGDEARLQQVLINLAGNAVKFTAAGGVGLRVTMTGDSRVRFAIADTGPGIPADRRDAIFLDFEQADGSSTRRHEGTGLGLAISRRIAESMGGSLRLESTGPEGSLFVCELPLRAADAAPEAASPPSLRGRRVLIAAQSPFEGPWLGESLGLAGAEVVHAAGEERAATELSGPDEFDIVIVDCALGEEATKRLAALARDHHAGRSLVLFSPFERRAFGQKSLGNFDGWLVKPVRAGSLVARLTDQQFKGRQDAAEEPDHAGAAKGMRVLLAEDNDINALIARKHLELMGACVVRARDGEEALSLARAAISGEAEAFDIIFLDIRMPGLDGTEVARLVRDAEREKGREPVRMVALTANAFDEDRRVCFEAGIDEFLTKPVDIEKLRTVVSPPDKSRKIA